MLERIRKAHDKLDQLDIHELFVYDETSLTCLRWKHMRVGNGGKLVPRRNNGQAGGISYDGFLVLNYQKSAYSIPKIIWMLHNGTIPDGYSLVFEDGDCTNAKLTNLKLREDLTDLPEKYCNKLKLYLEYDETSPSCLRWKGKTSHGSKVQKGDVAGSLDISDGYWKIHGFGNHYKVHRLVWFFNYGKIPEGLWIDHINGIRNDNRIENLRVVIPELNGRNRSKNKNNTTGHSMISYYEGFNQRGTLIRRYTVAVGVNRVKTVRGFSCVKYGDDEALRMAIECRDALIKKVNEQGAGYTERHGT